MSWLGLGFFFHEESQKWAGLGLLGIISQMLVKGIYKPAPKGHRPSRKTQGFKLFFNVSSGWACFGDKHVNKNTTHRDQFGIPIGVCFEKQRASTRKTAKRLQFCAPKTKGTGHILVLGGAKGFLYTPWPCRPGAIYRSLFRSQIFFVRRLVSRIRLLHNWISFVLYSLLLCGACLSFFVFGLKFLWYYILVWGSFATGPSFANWFRRSKNMWASLLIRVKLEMLRSHNMLADRQTQCQFC